jgi:type II secretory pathway component HofQ
MKSCINAQRRTLPNLCVVGLCMVTVIPFVAAVRGQQPDTAVQSVQPVKKAAHERPIERFSVNNADIRAVFKQLSDYAGYDIVLGDKVTGPISLTVSNKSWREILGIICKIANLSAIKENAYIYVVPTEEYRKQQLQEASQTQQEEAVEELRREVIKCNNAKADEMKNAIASLLSIRGKITVVERNNALIIYDTDNNIAQIRKTIRELDVETDQVSISCKIIEVSSGALADLAIGWGYFSQLGGTNVSATHAPGMSVPGQIDRLTFGVLSQDKLASSLSLLFQNNKAEVVAQPQITTLDNKEASIFLGSQVPILTMTPSAAAGAGNGQFVTTLPTVTMVDAGTNLIVTPHVTGEKRIMLVINATKSSYTLTGTGMNPIINRQSASTNVVVSDGETVVIAGLTSDEDRKLEEGIPILKDIPLLGNLFKHTKKTVDKSDLMVFVTPHIINKKIESVSVPAK